MSIISQPVTLHSLKQKIRALEEIKGQTTIGLKPSESFYLDAMRMLRDLMEQKPIGAFHVHDQDIEATTDYLLPGQWPIDNGVIEVFPRAAPAANAGPIKQPQIYDAHGFHEPAHVINNRWIEAIRAAGYEVQE